MVVDEEVGVCMWYGFVIFEVEIVFEVEGVGGDFVVVVCVNIGIDIGVIVVDVE